MNAVEIEEAVSELAAAPFDRHEFPFALLAAFGNKEATLKRLRSGAARGSDVPGGVLQRNNIHLATCDRGEVGPALAALRASPRTASAKAKFVLATDGVHVEAEDLVSGEPLACPYAELGQHFGFLLPLAGISTVRQIKDNPIDVKATGRLNKLYVELLKDNPDWAAEERRADLNQFMARLIFCFFSEDTGIFLNRLFTRTLGQMSDGTNTHEVIAELFRAMATPIERRVALGFRSWADAFPYVNGGLFAEAGECPRFSRIARSYLLRAAELSWREINPDIFGSMIQAVADDEERGALGMHYTSVPNILKVLDPLFLDSLREQLAAAGDSVRRLRALRRRIASIRVFDPACGSGNFLVIAYIRMREIEHEIASRTGDDPRSTIPLTNFYGIEIKGFAAEIARLALLIAEFQCDARLISQAQACRNVLPLHATGRIHVGNALRMNWLEVCPPVKPVMVAPTDLFDASPAQSEIDFEARGAETYICGNPPYKGSTYQTDEQKRDLGAVLDRRINGWKSLDYISGWFLRAADYLKATRASCAFVSTNSICQGEQVPTLWPVLLDGGITITFAHTSFRWSNLASHNAGVTVVVVGLGQEGQGSRRLYSAGQDDASSVRAVEAINPYLVPGPTVIVRAVSRTPDDRGRMVWGNKPTDDGNFFLDQTERNTLLSLHPEAGQFIRPFLGSAEFIRGTQRYCLWLTDENVTAATSIPEIGARVERVRTFRANSRAAETRPASRFPHRFRQVQGYANETSFIVPKVSSESRPYLPVGVLTSEAIISDNAFALYDVPLWNLALIASRLHLVWIATVCGKLKTDFRYSNTLGWNTFPVPTLTDNNKAELTAHAEAILLAREAHFPATIAELYDPDTRPENLRHAHEANDETLERIYIGRRFRNDTERLEHLFDLYTRLTQGASPTSKPKKKRAA